MARSAVLVLLVGLVLCLANASRPINVNKDEYLVNGVLSTSPHPFGMSPDIMEKIPHDKCALSVPVPGNDDSLTLVALGINRAVWVKKFNGEQWEDWVSLNGTASSGPSAIRDEKGQLHVFIRGLDGLIWHRYEKDSEWSEWLHLGNVKTTSGPVAVINSEGLISVFALGSNKAVWVNTQEGLRDSQGTCTSGKSFPTAEQEARSQNSQSIVTSDSGFNEDSASHKPIQLVQTSQVATTASAPTASAPTAAKTNSSEDDSAALRKALEQNATVEADREWSRIDSLKTTDDSVKEMKYVWSGWENLGGVWTNKPSVMLNHEGLLSVIVRGVDRSLYIASQETSTEHGLVWSDWVWLKGNFASVPKVSSISNAEGLGVITARGMDKTFYVKKQANDPSDGVQWGQWEPVGGMWQSGPTVLSPFSDTLELFGLGLDLSVWHKTFSANAEGDYFWSAPECLQGRFSSSVSLAKDTSGLLHVFTRGFDQAIWYKQQELDELNTPIWGNWTSLGGTVLTYPC